MADRVEPFLRDLITISEQAQRHLHTDNLNIVENLRRRLDDCHNTVQIILMYCIEHDVCVEVLYMLREIHNRLAVFLGHYNEICDRNVVENEHIQLSQPLIFEAQQTHEPGRPILNIPEDTLRELHDIHNSWSSVARLTGVSYRTLLRRRQQYGLEIANTVGPRITYTDLDDEQLCAIVRDILQLMPDAGETYVIGSIKSRGINIQRWRVRNAIQIVDPVSRALRCTLAVVRRVYNVRCPNALW